MPRMFDILREDNDSKKDEPKRVPPEKNNDKDADLRVNFPRQIRNGFGVSGEPKEISQPLEKLYSSVEKRDIDGIEVAKKNYHYVFKVIEALLKKISRDESLNVYIDEVYNAIDTLINQLILGNSLLENVVGQYPPDNYLPGHTTNVCILSLATGIQMNFNKSKLYTLGMAAIFHDIGMLDVNGIIEEPQRLSAQEYGKVKRHALKSAEIFSEIEGFYGITREIIEQHHERVDGSGYPFGIGGISINDYAKIIGLVDTYEAIIHRRPYRQAKLPHQAIREIIGPLKILFELKVIRAFVNKISIYPVGSFVKLNTGKIAKVISPNSSFPLQPVVLILLDSNLKRIPESKLLDLSQNNSIYINEPISLKKSEPD